MIQAVLTTIVVIVNFLLGFLVLARNRKLQTNQTFFFLVFSMNIWVVISYLEIVLNKSLFITYLVRADFSLGIIIGLLFYLFTFLFPNKFQSKFSKVLTTLNLIFGSVLLILAAFTTLIVRSVTSIEGGVELDSGSLFFLYLIFFVTIGIQSFYFLISKLIKTKGVTRTQIFYVLTGLISLFVIIIITNVVLPRFIDPRVSDFGIYGYLSFIAFTAYAAVRYRLMNVRFVVFRAFFYFLLVLFVVTLFVLLTFIFSTFFVEGAGYYSPILPILFGSVVIVFVLDPTKRFLGRLTEKVFYRGKVDYQLLLKNLSDFINNEIDLDVLIDEVKRNVRHGLKVQKILIVLQGKADKFFYLEEDTNEFIPFKLPPNLLDYLIEHKGVLAEGDLEREIEESKEAGANKVTKSLLEFFRSNKLTLVSPIFGKEKLIGMFFLGSKLSGGYFSKEDIDFVELLTPQLGSGIQKARLYKESLDFNLKLKEEVKRATEDLRIANEHLKELDTAKSEFISIASHQLRTPLTGIMGYLSMMVAGDFGKIDPVQLKILSDVYGASHRLIRIVNIFLNVSRIEAGRFYLDYKQVTFDSVVDEIVMELKPTATKKGITLEVDPSVKAIGNVTVDPDKLKDVCLNLVDNAIKYSQSGTISVSAKKEGLNVHCFVHDQGVGIDPEEAKRLFSKFVRGTGIARVQPNGSGLGLFIAKKVVEEHAGKIWVESEGEGKGSTFQFVIPIKPTKEQIDLQAKIASKVSKQKAQAAKDITPETTSSS